MAPDAKTRDEALARRLIDRLRFRDLQLLVLIREHRSLRAAAQRLNVTQPALSKALQRIEEAFGAALFSRASSGLVPTPAGEFATEGASLLLRQLAQVAAETSSEPAVGILRVGAPPFVAQGLLTGVFARLARDGSPMRVQLVEERVPSLIEALSGGQLDAIVSSYPTGHPSSLSESLRVDKLFDANFVVIAPKEHPLARARQVTWQRLSAARWVLPGDGSMVRRVIDGSFHRAGLRAPPPDIESTSPFTNLRLVAEGIGLSAVPESALIGMSVANRVQRVRVQPAMPSWPVALISRKEDNPRVRLLREGLHASLADQ